MKFAFPAPPAAPPPSALPSNHWRPRTTSKNKIAQIRASLTEIREASGDYAAWQATREVCKRDLFYLCHQVLGYKDLAEPLHDDLCDFIADAEKGRHSTLILIPRSHFKSTIATVGRIIQWMIRDPDTTIGLGSADLKNAKKFLREIRNHLEKNQTLKVLFPEAFFQHPERESPTWTQEQIIIRRTDACTAKEPTIKVFGLEDNLPTGDHFKHILIDDAVNQDNVKTEDRLAKVIDQTKYLIPLTITPDQPIHYVGTRYHVRDPYATMVTDPWVRVYFRKAVEDGQPIFPSRFTLETLERTRITLGGFIYSCQYMMEPKDPSAVRFQREWLRYTTRIYPDAMGYRFFLLVDPASTRKEHSDFTAMGVFAVDWKWNICLVDAVHDKLTPAQRIDKFFELCAKWPIAVAGYETIGFQATDKFWIERRMVEKSIHVQIVEIGAAKTAKDDRIRGIQPILEAGRFFLPLEGIPYTRLWEDPDDGQAQTINVVEEWLRQFDYFPMAVHDDLLDVTQMAREIIYGGHVPIPEEPPRPAGPYSESKRKGSTFNPMAR